MRAGINRLDAASGTSARLTKGVGNCALSASTTGSQCSSIVVPTPTARPCTAATSGRVQRASDWMKRTTLRLPSDLPDATAANSPTSLPAVNMSPSPRIRITRADGSSSADSMVSASLPYIASVSAFFLSGRASVRVRIPPLFSMRTCSVMGLLLLFLWISWKLVLNARQPARDDVDLRAGKSFCQRRIDLSRASLRLCQRGAALRRQPDTPGAPVFAVGPPLDQLCRRRAVDEARNTGRTEIERSARLAHQNAVLLAEDKQQPRLRRRHIVLR